MATFITRKGRVTALIRRRSKEGLPISMAKTFATQEEATIWADKANSYVDKPIDPIGLEDPIPLEIHMLTRYDAESGATGVYFLFHKGKCVYVGQSENVHVRVREHRLARNNRKLFDTYSFLPVARERLSEVEYKYITLLTPKLNSLGREDLKEARAQERAVRAMSGEARAAVRLERRKARGDISPTLEVAEKLSS